MKAYRLYSPGLGDLRRVDEPTPTPAHGEVLVRIRAVSLNYKDLLFVRPPDVGGIALPKPTIPLSDMAGEIVDVGSGVSRWTHGDRVTATVLSGWLDGAIPSDAMHRALGVGQDGVLCEYRVFSERDLVRLPSSYSFEEGSTLPIAPLSAWNCVRHVGAGETVLLLGTGGVALSGLQFAKASGAHAIVTSSSDAKLERARSMGADATINYRTSPNWHEVALEMTDGRGVDHVVETVGGSNLTKSAAATAIGGNIHLVGLQDMGLMDPYQIQYRALNVRGVRVGSQMMFEEMIDAIRRYDIVPVVDRAYSFENVISAYEYLRSADHFGKIVIRID